MTQISIPVSGTIDLTFALSGTYFSDIYYGEAPVLESVYVLKGGTEDFTSIELQTGATFSGGSVLIGSSSPSGVLQTFNFATRSVIDFHEVPELSTDNVEDFS